VASFIVIVTMLPEIRILRQPRDDTLSLLASHHLHTPLIYQFM